MTDNTQSTILRYPLGSPATPFDYGSGHLNPIAAIHPGLVYDYDLGDILDFLCSNGTTSAEVVYMGEHSHPTTDAVISANHAMLISVLGR